MSLTRETLLDYLTSELSLDASSVDDATLLFSSSILDSFNMVELTAFIERSEGLRFSTSDFSLDNLDSVERILGFVNSRRAQTKAA